MVCFSWWRVPSSCATQRKLFQCSWGGTASARSALEKDGDFVTLFLRRRKNRATPSSITRGCWRNRSTRTFPLHRLGPLLEAAGTGMQLLEGLTAARALGKMRDILEDLGRFYWHCGQVAVAVACQASAMPWHIVRTTSEEAMLSTCSCQVVRTCMSANTAMSLSCRSPLVGDSSSRRLEISGFYGIP